MNITFMRVFWTVLSLMYTALTFYLSTLSITIRFLKWRSAQFPWLRGDWVIHILEYAILAILLYITGRAYLPLKRRMGLYLAGIVLLTAGIGALNEFVQSFIPGREVSLGDGFANMVGAMLGVGIAWGVNRWRERKAFTPSPGWDVSQFRD